MKRKLIPLLLAAALLTACLSGCGSKPVKVDVTESPAPTSAPAATATEAPAPEETDDPEALARMARYKAAYEKYPADKVVLKIGDSPVTWGEYFSWIFDLGMDLEENVEFDDWNEALPDLAGAVLEATPDAYVRQRALGYSVQIAVIEQKAKELGVTLTQEQLDEVQATLDGYAEYFGGQEAFEELLADSYLPLEYFRRQNEAMILLDNLFEAIYGVDGANLPEEDTVSFLKDAGYLYAKHILFRTVDDDYQPLSDEEIAEKKAEAEGVLAQLRACDPADLETLFDSLMMQYSEDPGVLAYPDGYYFLAGQMVPSFEEAVLSLEENGVSELVETDYGFHIIYCPPMRGDHVMEYDSNYTPYSPQAYVAARLFDDTVSGWFDSAKQSALYVDDFYALDLNELIGK